MRLTRRWLARLATVGLVAGCAPATPSPGTPSPSNPTPAPTPAPTVVLSGRETKTRTVTTKAPMLGLDVRETDVVEFDGGAAVVRDAAGRLLLLVEAPTVRRGPGAAETGRWQVQGNQLLAITGDGKPLAADRSLRVETLVGRRLVSSVDRESWRGKPRWLITPSELGREAPLGLLQTEGWTQARELGDIPWSTSLRNQFVCHPASLVARSKPTWNIEAARDASNLAQTMAAGCNPEN